MSLSQGSPRHLSGGPLHTGLRLSRSSGGLSPPVSQARAGNRCLPLLGARPPLPYTPPTFISGAFATPLLPDNFSHGVFRSYCFPLSEKHGGKGLTTFSLLVWVSLTAEMTSQVLLNSLALSLYLLGQWVGSFTHPGPIQPCSPQRTLGPWLELSI